MRLGTMTKAACALVSLGSTLMLACGDDLIEGEPVIQITNPAAQDASGTSDAGAKPPEDEGDGQR